MSGREERSYPKYYWVIPTVFLILLILFNFYAFTRPFAPREKIVLEWRKGPLIYDCSPYSTMNAIKFFWPVSALMLDSYLMFLLVWSVFTGDDREKGGKNYNRSGKLRIEIIIPLLAIVIILAGGEMMTRELIRKFMFIQYRPHPDLAWYNRPNLKNHRDETDQASKTTNSLGFRMKREIPKKKKQGEFRIFIVGDSSTFGYGVDDDKTFASVMEKKLREDTGLDVMSIDTACPGHTSFQGLFLLKKYGSRVDPDLIVWAYNNDSCLDTEEDKDRISKSSFAREVQRILFRSDYYLLLRRVILDTVYAWKIDEYQKKFSMNSYDWVRRIPFEDYKEYLQEFADYAAKRNIGIIFIRMPLNEPMESIEKIYATSFDVKYREYLCSFTEQKGLPCINFEKEFLSEYSPDLFLPGQLFHPSVKGHRIIGTELAEYIEQNMMNSDKFRRMAGK